MVINRGKDIYDPFELSYDDDDVKIHENEQSNDSKHQTTQDLSIRINNGFVERKKTKRIEFFSTL